KRVASVFFFQAEDGIRDWSVTGVQTCALPIFRQPLTVPPPTYAARPEPGRSLPRFRQPRWLAAVVLLTALGAGAVAWLAAVPDRSEERRVGKEGQERPREHRIKKNADRQRDAR